MLVDHLARPPVDPEFDLELGMLAVSELTVRLGVIDRLDAVIGPIGTRGRGHTAGELLVGMAAAQRAGEESLVGLDRQRADVAGQVVAPVVGLCSTTAAAVARRLRPGQWAAVATGIGDVHTAMLGILDRLASARAEGLSKEVTIDMNATDVEVYGLAQAWGGPASAATTRTTIADTDRQVTR